MSDAVTFVWFFRSLVNILIVVVKDWQAKDPHLFNLNKSNLRVFSVTETIFSLGGMVGPLLTGSLFEKLGFFYMTVVLGKSHYVPDEYVLLLTNTVILCSCRLPHSSGGFMALAG